VLEVGRVKPLKTTALALKAFAGTFDGWKPEPDEVLKNTFKEPSAATRLVTFTSKKMMRFPVTELLGGPPVQVARMSATRSEMPSLRTAAGVAAALQIKTGL
jgi:hypothetical protein